MEHYKLEHHTNRCLKEKHEYELLRQANKDFLEIGRIHFCQSDDFLFFANNQFYIITYNCCIGSYSHLDTKLNMLNQIFTNSKRERYRTSKSWHLGNAFDEMSRNKFKADRIYKYLNEIKLIEVNHIYYDNAGKEYSICTELPFSKGYFECFDLDNELERTVNYLQKNGLEYLVEEAELLYACNQPIIWDERKVVKTLDKLIKSLNQTIKS